MLSRIAVFVWFCLPLAAQVGGGSIVGYVTDPTGQPVTGAKVTAMNPLTNVDQETKTNETGYYEFPLLAAGRYRVEARAAGFETTVRSEFDLNAGTRPRIDLQLKVGSVSESVMVTAA